MINEKAFNEAWDNRPENETGHVLKQSVLRGCIETYEMAKFSQYSKYPLRDKCEEKAARLEMPYFTLIACDNYATKTIFYWLEFAKETGLSADKLKETNNILIAMQNWRDSHPELCKNPD